MDLLTVILLATLLANTLASSILFYYYWRLARVIKGGVGYKYYLTGVFFVFPMLFSHHAVISGFYESFFHLTCYLWMILVPLFVFLGMSIIISAIKKGHREISLLKLLGGIPYMRYLVIGIILLVVHISADLSIDIWWGHDRLGGAFSQISLLGSITSFMVGGRKVYSAIGPAIGLTIGPAAAEDVLLRDDIRAFRACSDLTSRFSATAAPIIGIEPLRNALSKCSAEHEILDGCELSDEGILKIDNAVRALGRMDEKESTPKIYSAFSALNSRFIDLYGAVTSPKVANGTIEKIYKTVQEKYKSLPTFPEILRGMPAGVLEDEKLALANREELEQKVLERTAELKKINEQLQQEISERKRAEEELRKHRNNLKELVEKRTAELKKINEQLQQEITERKRTEEALRESEERYRVLVETMNEGLDVLDENGLIIYANDKFCEMLGYSRDEIIGRPITDFCDKINQNILKEHLDRERKGERVSYELARIRKDGQKIFTITSAAPIFDADGHFKGSFAVITDITEHKRAEEERIKAAADKQRMEQLEKFAKVAVGRELKMIELKKRINELNKMLKVK